MCQQKIVHNHTPHPCTIRIYTNIRPIFQLPLHKITICNGITDRILKVDWKLQLTRVYAATQIHVIVELSPLAVGVINANYNWYITAVGSWFVVD